VAIARDGRGNDGLRCGSAGYFGYWFGDKREMKIMRSCEMLELIRNCVKK